MVLQFEHAAAPITAGGGGGVMAVITLRSEQPVLLLRVVGCITKYGKFQGMHQAG